MKYLLPILLLFTTLSTKAQDFYDLNTIQTIEITFAQSNWDQLLDIAYASTGDYILAQSVTINGEVIDSVGVKYKGNSTYNSNQAKNPFHIELDTYKDHEYDGYPGSNDFPNLVYLGDNSTSYDDAYEIKSADGWDELIDLCDTLANDLNDIELILDVDKAIWMLAFNNVLVNLDSYSGGFKQNYYLYREDNGRFASVVWDLT